MNTDGGTLIIGVDDDKNILGLDSDIGTLSKQDIDGFQLHLTQLCRNYIGADLISHIKVKYRNAAELLSPNLKAAKIIMCAKVIHQDRSQGKNKAAMRICAGHRINIRHKW